MPTAVAIWVWFLFNLFSPVTSQGTQYVISVKAFTEFFFYRITFLFKENDFHWQRRRQRQRRAAEIRLEGGQFRHRSFLFFLLKKLHL